ncbi:MAG: hypothetical protein JOZ54_07545 [Acidobacteria bacterium]|nr:hypothetical protein [Acidobacteriota bacterium]
MKSELKRLETWETSVPPRARRFRAVCAALRRQIEEAVPSWRLWVDGQVIARYGERVDRLDGVARAIANLEARTELLDSEVHRFSDTAKGNDAELEAWISGRCRDWLVGLGRLTETAERESDVYNDEVRFGQIEKEMRATREAVSLLREAQRIADALGADVRSAGLRGNLPQFRARLFANDAGAAWQEEIKASLQPLQTFEKRVQDPPPEIGNVGLILTELRGWSELLHEAEAEIERLEERRMVAMEGDDPATLAQRLLDEAKALRERLLALAERQRSEKLREIEDAMADLRQVCGDQPELDTRFAELRARPVTRPHFFHEWLGYFDRFQQRFHALAEAYVTILEARLRDIVDRVEKKLAALEARPLSEGVGTEAVLLRRQLHAFPSEPAAEEMLRLLRQGNRMEREVDALAVRAENELRELDELRETLSAQNAALQAEVQRTRGVSLKTGDLARPISRLARSVAEESLEERRRRALSLATELKTLETQFVQECRAHLDRQLVDLQRLDSLLRRASAAFPAAVMPSIADGASPHDAAEAMLDAGKLDRVLRQKARSVRRELEQRRQRAAEELAKLSSDDLTPVDRETAAQLTTDIAANLPGRPNAVMEHVEALTAIVARADEFFDGLLREQRSARNRFASLQKSYRRFNEEQLYRFCPELAHRVAALIYGIPEQPRHWGAVLHQLALAAQLFERIDKHARRLAADELYRAAEWLRQPSNGRSGAAQRQSIEETLAELDAWGLETLPPVALRVRVLGLYSPRR